MRKSTLLLIIILLSGCLYTLINIKQSFTLVPISPTPFYASPRFEYKGQFY